MSVACCYSFGSVLNKPLQLPPNPICPCDRARVQPCQSDRVNRFTYSIYTFNQVFHIPLTTHETLDQVCLDVRLFRMDQELTRETFHSWNTQFYGSPSAGKEQDTH